MYLSRVTWLVLGTTLVLVSAVLVAAVVFDGELTPVAEEPAAPVSALPEAPR